MKLVLGFLTIYVLVLSALPCRDVVDDLPNPILSSVTHVDSSRSNPGHEKHEHRRDGCSPFCSCQCCNLKMETLQMFETIFDRKEVVQISVTQYEIDAPSIDNYPNQIWQPPKYIA